MQHPQNLSTAICVMSNLELNLGVLISEALQKTFEQFVSVVNSLGILANDPDHGGSVMERSSDMLIFGLLNKGGFSIKDLTFSQKKTDL